MGSKTLAPKAQTFPQKAPNSHRSLRVGLKVVFFSFFVFYYGLGLGLGVMGLECRASDLELGV